MKVRQLLWVSVVMQLGSSLRTRRSHDARPDATKLYQVPTCWDATRSDLAAWTASPLQQLSSGTRGDSKLTSEYSQKIMSSLAEGRRVCELGQRSAMRARTAGSRLAMPLRDCPDDLSLKILAQISYNEQSMKIRVV